MFLYKQNMYKSAYKQTIEYTKLVKATAMAFLGKHLVGWEIDRRGQDICYRLSPVLLLASSKPGQVR